MAKLLFVCLFVFLLATLLGLLINRLKGRPMSTFFDDEEVVTTTTTTTTHYADGPTLDIVGSLKRQFDGAQAFVIDPVDGDKVWLNSRDDMYEDGAGKVWKLV